MEFERAGDVLVAGVAAACTIVIAVAAIALGPLSILFKMAPLYVYFLFIFTRKGGPYGDLDTPRNWSILAVVVTIAVLAYMAI